jgi:hypothetical protein
MKNGEQTLTFGCSVQLDDFLRTICGCFCKMVPSTIGNIADNKRKKEKQTKLVSM